MPKIFWMFVAGVLVGEHYGGWFISGLVVLELVGYYVSGIYEAWRADRGSK